jgi:hypothetical protein
MAKYHGIKWRLVLFTMAGLIVSVCVLAEALYWVCMLICLLRARYFQVDNCNSSDSADISLHGSYIITNIIRARHLKWMWSLWIMCFFKTVLFENRIHLDIWNWFRKCLKISCWWVHMWAGVLWPWPLNAGACVCPCWQVDNSEWQGYHWCHHGRIG